MGWRPSLSKVKNSDSLGMEDLGLVDPSFDSSGDREHGEDHFRDLLVESKGELVNQIEFFFGS